MAFFGVEVKPGKPFSHRFEALRGRLHISHATLGTGSSTKRCLIQCNVGDKTPILLCSLTPERNDSCQLDLEFEEEDEVLFSVLGPHSVHLTGYYLGNAGGYGGDGHDTLSDSYGEDIAETESENSSFYDSDEDEYEDDFIDDDDETDSEMYPPGPPSSKRKTGVVIEEIVDEKPANSQADRKRLKKKTHVSDSDGENQQQIVVRRSNGILLSETEDEDGFPVNSHFKGKPDAEKAAAKEKFDKKGGKNKVEDVSDQPAGSKRKVDAIDQDENERVTKQQKDSSVQSMENEHETGEKSKKKKKKKQRVKEVENKGAESGDTSNDAPKDNAQIEVERSRSQHETGQELPNDKNIDTRQDDTEVKKKKKKKKSKAQKGANVGDVVETPKDSIENKEKKAESKRSPQVRSFSNGLVVEELKMGKADGKKASPGSKVSVHYIGKLKKNGKIFDSNIGKAPFKFRLGVGQVIKGWDVGVNGMRIGDKRKLTIPPSMGYTPPIFPHIYGAQKVGTIPPNAWLEFDVELVDVR
ncbi:hypothetical protein Sjap_020826 [Stephania japonica]|uniref:peptidylprolyl isomerase n=1 Tax=Stephania japonica TaxID=461633 RepID=A0AAP0HZB9_9MAGN